MNILKKMHSSRMFNSILKTISNRNSQRSIFESCKRTYPATYEGDGKTTASITNTNETDGLMIATHSPHGFRLNNRLFVRGSMAIFPNTVLSWQVSKIEDANEAAFSLFYILDPKLDILVIGVGDKKDCTRERRIILAQIMKKNNIPVEILPTDTACSTYNFLVSEDRFAAAVLIPPTEDYHEKDLYDRGPEPFNIFSI